MYEQNLSQKEIPDLEGNLVIFVVMKKPNTPENEKFNAKYAPGIFMTEKGADYLMGVYYIAALLSAQAEEENKFNDAEFKKVVDSLFHIGRLQ